MICRSLRHPRKHTAPPDLEKRRDLRLFPSCQMLTRRSAWLAGACSSFLLLLLLLHHSTTASPPPRNSQLLQRVASRLVRGDPIVLGIVGGSISAQRGGYGEQVVSWLNRNWPPQEGEHKLLNGAVPASESSLAAVCLDTLLQGIRPDLLLVEYAYNDASLADEDSIRAAVESITRQALLGESAVVMLEFAGYSHNRGHMELGQATNDFQNSVGNLHAQVGEYYSAPKVDVARYLYAFADAERLLNFTDGIHPNVEGHTLVATLVVQFLLDLVLADPTTSTPDRVDWLHRLALTPNGPSWLHPPPRTSSPHPAVSSPTLSRLPPAIWSSPSPLPLPWSCIISQIASTLPSLRLSAIRTEGWTFGPDLSDGGPFRSGSRPGFRTLASGKEEEDAHLVFKLGRAKEVKRVALLYRRSWQASGRARVWVDREGEAVGQGEGSGKCSRELGGQWKSQTTQMVLDVVCEEGEADWRSQQEDEGGKEEAELFLHVVARRREYFKVYGYATG